MIEWTTALSLSARITKAGYDQRNLIQKYWTIAKAKLDIGSTQVVVTGNSGVGKSILTAQLHGNARNLFYETPTESLWTEVEAISLGEWTKLVRVLPGQKSRRVKGSIEAFQRNDSLEGVIHVVDFGYTAPRDPVISASLIKDAKLDSIKKLREYNLKLEIEDLIELLSDIRKLQDQCGRPKWLIIAVNKVDLYVDKQSDALAYYHPHGTSEFSKILNNFQNEIGSKNIQIYLCEACAHEINFEWNGEIAESKLARQKQNVILKEFANTLATITAITYDK